MKTKHFFLLIVILIVLPLISAQLTFKKSTEINLRVPCSFNGTFCSESAECNVTIIYPNNTIMINNLGMTNEANGMPNYTLPDSSIMGEYEVHATCLQDGISGSNSFAFFITGSGEQVTTAQGIIYMVVLLGSIGAFGLCLFGTFRVPWGHSRSGDGRIISINDLKFVKILLFGFSYLLLLWVFFLLRIMSSAFLFLYLN